MRDWLKNARDIVVLITLFSLLLSLLLALLIFENPPTVFSSSPRVQVTPSISSTTQRDAIKQGISKTATGL
jgi:hypothetical protein